MGNMLGFIKKSYTFMAIFYYYGKTIKYFIGFTENGK